MALGALSAPRERRRESSTRALSTRHGRRAAGADIGCCDVLARPSNHISAGSDLSPDGCGVSPGVRHPSTQGRRQVGGAREAAPCDARHINPCPRRLEARDVSRVAPEHDRRALSAAKTAHTRAKRLIGCPHGFGQRRASGTAASRTSSSTARRVAASSRAGPRRRRSPGGWAVRPGLGRGRGHRFVWIVTPFGCTLITFRVPGPTFSYRCGVSAATTTTCPASRSY